MKNASKNPKSKAPGKIAPGPAVKTQASYRKTVLPNGVRVISEEIPHVRSVSVGIWVDTGSRDEIETNNGISHFVEHMVFKGTNKRSVREIAQSIESLGGYLNAFTGKEHTCFYARVLDEDTETAVDVLSDMAIHSTFPEKEIEKERGVVIEELKNAEDDPDDIIHDYFEKALFGLHALGFPVIGTEKNLRSFSRKELLDFRTDRYIPSKMVVAAAGHIGHDQLVELTKRYLDIDSRLPKPNGWGRTVPRIQKSAKSVHEKPIQQAHICLGTVGFGIKSPHRYPLLVLNSLLGDGMSSRLFQNIREKYGFAYSVYSFANMMADTGTFGAYIGTDVNHVDQCVELIWKELEKLKVREVPAAELKRTKSQLKGGMMLNLESIPSRMIRLGSSELYFGELSSLDSIIRKIDAVTQEDLKEVAVGLFREETFSSIIFKPANHKSGT
ncbi:MAG: pitrilysin family protein [Bacteroidota bacterium]